MRSLMLLAAVAAFVLAPLSSAQDKKAGKRYALLIGVQKYGSDDLHDLECADKDVHDLADTLRVTGYRKGDVTVLSTREKGAPTVKAIRAAIKEFVERDYRKEDTVLIAFSGHGIQVGKRFYFCPQGARIPADPKEDDLRGLISVDELYRELKACKAGYRLVLTDCCRNNPYRAPRKVREVSDDLDLAEGMPRDVVMITSCSPGQKAYEDKDLGRGVFFHFVIEAMRGKADLNEDGVVTRAELEAYLRVQMAKHKSKQTPETITRSRLDPPLAVLGDNGPPPGVLAPVARIVRDQFVYRSPFAAINVNAKFAATADGESLQLFDLEKRRRVDKSLPTEASHMTRIAFTRSGAVLLAGNAAGLLVNPLNGKTVSPIKLKFSPSLMGLARDEKRVWMAHNGDLVVLDARGNKVEDFSTGGEHVGAASLVGSGEQIVIGTGAGKMFLYDVDKGKQIHELEGHEKGLVGIWTSKDGSLAASICQGGKLIRWDLQNNKLLDKTDVNAGTDTPYTAAFQADGRRVIIGHTHGSVSIVDLPPKGKPKAVATYDKHAKSGNSASVSIAADGSRAVSVGGTQLWIYELPKE